MGICRPCYGVRAWSLSNCCERLFGHGTADLDYKTAYGHALGCTKNGIPPWPWEALLLLRGGSGVIGSRNLLRNEDTHILLRGERWPQGTPAAAGDTRQCPGLCLENWHSFLLTALRGSVTDIFGMWPRMWRWMPVVTFAAFLWSQTMALHESPGSMLWGESY